jgi:hypothetical protein
MAVIIGDDNDKIKKIEELYLNCSTILVDEQQQKAFEASKAPILDWFEND